jgi:hypothetical protein
MLMSKLEAARVTTMVGAEHVEDYQQGRERYDNGRVNPNVSRQSEGVAGWR